MTKNFKLKEFECKGGCDMPLEVYENIIKLASQLQFLRDYTGRPITINSAYRSPVYNRQIGGVPTSQHLGGKAADIVIEGVSPSEVADAIDFLIECGLMKEGGLGRYDTFTHYDIRGKKARWDYTTESSQS